MQIPQSATKWYEIIGEKTLADAILDRIVQEYHRLEINRESIRINKQQYKFKKLTSSKHQNRQ